MSLHSQLENLIDDVNRVNVSTVIVSILCCQKKPKYNYFVKTVKPNFLKN